MIDSVMAKFKLMRNKKNQNGSSQTIYFNIIHLEASVKVMITLLRIHI